MTGLRWGLGVVGAAVLAYGVTGLLTAERGPRLLDYVVFAIVGLVGHDAVLAPVGLAVGAACARLVPPTVRGLVAGTLFVSAALTVVALPFVLGFGRTPDVPSALPFPYGRNLLVVLAAVWTGATLVAAIRLVRHRRAHDGQRGNLPSS